MAHLKGWPQGDGEMLDVTGDLATALAQNPKLHVMIASGYYDLACPMGGVAYELSQMEGGQPIVSRIQQHKYVGGHMMYINPSAEQQLSGDIRDFVGNPL
jgi:carboxypeptidase C (cathepsin A)